MFKLLLLSLIFFFTFSADGKKTTTPRPGPTTTPSPSPKAAAANGGGPGGAGGANPNPTTDDEDSPDDVCNKKKRCKDRFAVCTDRQCYCKPGFFENPTNGKCTKAPTVGDNCDADKNNIMSCDGVGVSPICPKKDGVAVNKCECLKGYEPKGKICVFKDQNLGEKCDGDEDCGVAFSSCQNGKCSCAAGFTPDKNICKQTAFKCPSGEPLKDGANVKVCEVKEGQPKGDRGRDDDDNDADSNDSCPSGNFCFSNPLVRSSSGGKTGYCCPNVATSTTPVCPAGDPVKVNQCASEADTEGGQDDTPTSDANSCPALTHACTPVADATYCCPVPCPTGLSFFAVEGRCKETLRPESPCKYDVQCGRTARCDGNSKTCVCKENFTLEQGICVEAEKTSGTQK